MSADTFVETVTCEHIREVLLELVAESPDRVDPRSVNEVRPRYWGPDGPACLVACALLALGFEEVVLRQLDAEFPIGELLDNGVRIDESRNPTLRARLDETAIKLLAYLQDAQEGGLPWVDAYWYAYAKPNRLIPQRYIRDRRPWMFAA